jgi:hypothetical protein
MKKISILLFFTMLLTVVSCKKKEPGLVTFKVYSEVGFELPPNTTLDLVPILTPGVTQNWNAEFTNNNTDKDKVREMKLNDLTLVIKSPPGKTFKFLQNIDVYIQAENLQETLVAYAHDIPETVGQSLVLTPVDVDLAPYAKKDAFKLRISTKPDEYNPDYVEMDAQMHFLITADVIN